MTKHSHNFVENYDGVGAFGWNRETDEETLKYYLQKFSDDRFLEILTPRLTEMEIEEVYDLITRLLKKHLSEPEYHRHFLKDGTHGHDDGKDL
jgi:hypothetical protein